ncbi:MAG: Uncharacterised protein [SAR116 cluster bacterium]|nr:MAG: Uncharacterised protein [SAR116 cluster bacterium]
MVPALDHVLDTEFQIVAQIIKAEFVIGAIGDVSTIGLATFVICQIAGNASNAHPQALIDAPHPAGVARRQIVIDGNNMHTLAVQRVQKDSKRCDKGLALTSLHFRNLARMKCNATHQLDIVMPLAKGAFCGLAHPREGGWQEAVKRLALVDPGTQIGERRAQQLITQRRAFIFQRVNRRDLRRELFDSAVIIRTEQIFRQRPKHLLPHNSG